MWKWIILAVLCWLAWIQYERSNAPAPGEAVVGKDAPEMHGLGWDKVAAPQTIQTRGGGSKAKSAAAKKSVNLPDEVVNNEKIWLLDAIKIGPKGSSPGSTVAGTLDSETGKPVLYVREDPLGWKPRVRADGSITIGPAITNNGTAGAVMADINLLSINKFTVKAWGIALAPSNAADPVAAAGVGLSYEFDLLRKSP